MQLRTDFIFLVIILSSLGMACNPSKIVKNRKINGFSETEVLNKFGAPFMETYVDLYNNVSLLEYRSDLYNLVQKKEDGDTLKIKEMFWENNKYKRVVWLKKVDNKWIAFDNLLWTKDIQM